MPCQLLADCLSEVFENLENDKITLHSCLLVSRLWCKISVRILWRNIWNSYDRQSEASAILSTLISCLPNESKELLHKNKIFISIPSKRPLFNYAAFCKILPINEIGRMIDVVLPYATTSPRLLDRNCLVLKEILKMFMNQIPSLKSLTYHLSYKINIPDNFTSFLGASDCLAVLSELCCSSKVHSDFFYGLSQICHNLQSLNIDFESEVSNGLKELVSLQNNLKNLELSAYGGKTWADIIPALTNLSNHSNTITKLLLRGNTDCLPLSFVSLFLNLQEIQFSLYRMKYEDFKELQYATFPRLRVLKISHGCVKPEYLIKFLEINGKNLKEFYVKEKINGLDLFIVKFCPNLKKLGVVLDYDKLDMLKTIFNSFQHLEGIIIRCREGFLNEKEILEIVANHSPKKFYKLKLINVKIFPEDLESFFVSWGNRISKKSLSLFIVDDLNNLKMKGGNMKIIKKYKNLGIVKEFDGRF